MTSIFICSVSKLFVPHAAKSDGDTTQATSETTQPVGNGDVIKAQDEVHTPDEFPDELSKGISYF